MTKLTSTILVLVNDEGKTDIESVIGNGNILWSGKNGFEWIGKGKEEWESVFLIRYQNIPECQNVDDELALLLRRG